MVKKQGESDQQLIRRFSQAVKSSGLLDEIKRLSFHETKQEEAKRKAQARARAKKLYE